MNKWNTSDGENSSEEYQQNITEFIEANLGIFENYNNSSNSVFVQLHRYLTFWNCSHQKFFNPWPTFLSGASHVNYETLIPLTIIYSVFLVIGILGNLATCVVILNNEYLR